MRRERGREVGRERGREVGREGGWEGGREEGGGREGGMEREGGRSTHTVCTIVLECNLCFFGTLLDLFDGSPEGSWGRRRGKGH